MEAKSVENTSEFVIAKEKSEGNLIEGTLCEAAPSASTPPSVDLAAKKRRIEGNAVLEEQKFQKKMTDLNDDVCLDILKNLNLLDLATATEVNRMFKRCAERTFETVHEAILDFDKNDIEMTFFKRILNKFGASTVDLTVPMWYLKNHQQNHMNMLISIARSCGPHLRKLALHGFKMDFKKCDNNETKLISRLVSKLTDLSISSGFFLNWNVIFDFCEAIETLSLFYVSMDDVTRSSFLRTYPNLQTLIVTNSRNGQAKIPLIDIVKVLRLNTNIRKLMLEMFISQQLIDAVVRLPELTNLFISAQENLDHTLYTIHAIAQIKKLQRLKLSYFPLSAVESLVSSLNGNKSLTYLDLSGIKMDDEFIIEFSRIQNLEVLKLSDVSYIDTKPDSDERFDKLVEFHVLYSCNDTQTKILLPEIMKMMPNLRLLNIVLLYSLPLNLEVAQEVSDMRSSDSSKLILFWDVSNYDVVEVKSIQNMIAVYRTDNQTNYSSHFDYDLSDFSINYKTLMDISKNQQFVKLGELFSFF